MKEHPGRAGGSRLLGRGLLVLLAAGLLLMILGSVLLWHAWRSPPSSPPPGGQVVRVGPGASLTTVADTLAGRGLLDHPRLFAAVARLTGRDRQIKAGRYAFAPGMTPRQLLRQLTEGRTLPIVVMLPEGVTAREAARIMAAALGFSSARFLAQADSLVRQGVLGRGMMTPAAAARYDSLLDALARADPDPTCWSEGYLASDTYHFAEGTTAHGAAAEVVQLGLARAESAASWASPSVRALGLGPHEVVSLASIVETETSSATERGRVAAVYLNRLREGWRLEADPTVAYALGKQGERLRHRDLRVDSPYNTYRHDGLPPGPICSPGVASLRAAAAPDTTCHAFFFVADGQGGHVFSASRAEHERAVRRYLRGLESGDAGAQRD
jgi:UPF0755 protein